MTTKRNVRGRPLESSRRYLSLVTHVEAQNSLVQSDYEKAADLSNLCRSEGVATTTIDMQICAIALNYHLAVFTTDRDFTRYSDVIGLQLHISNY